MKPGMKIPYRSIKPVIKIVYKSIKLVQKNTQIHQTSHKNTLQIHQTSHKKAPQAILVNTRGKSKATAGKSEPTAGTRAGLLLAQERAYSWQPSGCKLRYNLV